MSRPSLIQGVIDDYIAQISQDFNNNPNNSNWGQIQGQDAQILFNDLTKNYAKLLLLITFMKTNNTKPQPIIGEWDTCQKEIYLEFIKRGYPLDMELANKILNTIFK